MRRAVVRKLVEHNAACGLIVRVGPTRRRYFCLRPPGHAGPCSERFDQRKPTTEEKLQRKLAKASALAKARDRSEKHLRGLLRGHKTKIERIESYPLYRLEYRLRGGARRLRRYYRIVRNRTWRRRAWKRRLAA